MRRWGGRISWHCRVWVGTFNHRAGDGDAYTSAPEAVVILRGKIEWVFYDDNGAETERVTLDADGDLRMLNIERDCWHSLVCLESGSVLFECKDGGYVPLGEEEIMKV